MACVVLLSAPYSGQFVRSAVPRRASTPISTVRQASTQAPRIINYTQRMGKGYTLAYSKHILAVMQKPNSN